MLRTNEKIDLNRFFLPCAPFSELPSNRDRDRGRDRVTYLVSELLTD